MEIGITRPQTIAFNGKLVASKKSAYPPVYEEDAFGGQYMQLDGLEETITAYFTAKGNLLFHYNLVYNCDEYSTIKKVYRVFSSLQQARKWAGDEEIIEQISQALNDHLVVELDI